MDRKFWGIYLVMFGLGMLANFTGIFNIFLNGWWTLPFLIIPSAVNLIAQKNKLINSLTLFVGIIMFFNGQGFMGSTFWKIILALIFVLIGVNAIYPIKKK
jgi:uncharacterized membrane protein